MHFRFVKIAIFVVTASAVTVPFVIFRDITFRVVTIIIVFRAFTIVRVAIIRLNIVDNRFGLWFFFRKERQWVFGSEIIIWHQHIFLGFERFYSRAEFALDRQRWLGGWRQYFLWHCIPVKLFSRSQQLIVFGTLKYYTMRFN